MRNFGRKSFRLFPVDFVLLSVIVVLKTVILLYSEYYAELLQLLNRNGGKRRSHSPLDEYLSIAYEALDRQCSRNFSNFRQSYRSVRYNLVL